MPERSLNDAVLEALAEEAMDIIYVTKRRYTTGRDTIDITDSWARRQLTEIVVRAYKHGVNNRPSPSDVA